MKYLELLRSWINPGYRPAVYYLLVKADGNGECRDRKFGKSSTKQAAGNNMSVDLLSLNSIYSLKSYQGSQCLLKTDYPARVVR